MKQSAADAGSPPPGFGVQRGRDICSGSGDHRGQSLPAVTGDLWGAPTMVSPGW